MLILYDWPKKINYGMNDDIDDTGSNDNMC